MDVIKKILIENEALINNKDLVYIDDNSIKGREYDPHISLLIDFNRTDADNIMDLINDNLPIKVTISEISSFDFDDCRVIKYDIESESLQELHKRIVDEFEIEEKYPSFKPHITLAYVNPGAKLPNEENSSLVGTAFYVTEAIYDHHYPVGKLIKSED